MTSQADGETSQSDRVASQEHRALPLHTFPVLQPVTLLNGQTIYVASNAQFSALSPVMGPLLSPHLPSPLPTPVAPNQLLTVASPPLSSRGYLSPSLKRGGEDSSRSSSNTVIPDCSTRSPELVSPYTQHPVPIRPRPPRLVEGCSHNVPAQHKLDNYPTDHKRPLI